MHMLDNGIENTHAREKNGHARQSNGKVNKGIQMLDKVMDM